MQTLLLLHGWGGNADSWAPISQYFRRDYQVLTPEFACPPATVYTLDDYVRDLEQYLQAHQVTRCAVVAHSFGARLVAVLNAKRPDLFSKIVITGGAGLRPRFSGWRWLKIRWFKLRRQLFGRTDGGSAEYRALDNNGQATFRNLINRDLAPEITHITAPLLLINGDRDTATPLYLAKRWRKLAKNAKSCRLQIYHGHGHFAYLESRARFIKDVAEFLDE